ncbi:site-specific integrase [Tenacibaculum aquimarinum]|uniref:site-specific integrase n=1 Tax=Tenacibaculum aquimarinum TaxID=2910675 RepID=UPI001F0B278C|nr:site-specific integrase [Tenacibaculum aquimarinum]MCH3885687.1 site-specific integrase [Tenacibaculum aquimarinum]
MNNYKITVLFIIQRNKKNKKGLCPLRCRITYKQKRKIFSIGSFINPDLWNNSKQKAEPPNRENNNINSQLSLISHQINEAFLMLKILPNDFDVDDIYRKYRGEDSKEEITILKAYDLHNQKTKKLIGIDFNELSWSRYVESRRKVALFISKTYKRKDILLKKLDLKFIKDLEYFYKTELNLKQATVYRSLQRFKKIILFSIAENYLDKDPFILFKNKKHKTKIVYLSVEELKLLEDYQFNQLRLQKVKDLFIFCCYTGLAYNEMANLNSNHIIKNFDDNLWIKINRQKTDEMISIPLLEPAKAIIDKYKTDEFLLPEISNQRFNSYLREITEIIGIKKKLTHHIARKTFATTVLLYNDVPIEIVSKLLGHSNISITQGHYAKVVQHKVSSEMNKLSKKLKKKG